MVLGGICMGDITRRAALVGLATSALTVAWAPSSYADARGQGPFEIDDLLSNHALTATVGAVTPEHAAVVVHASDGRAVTVSQGGQTMTRSAKNGVAVLGLPVTKDAVSRIDVVVGRAHRQVQVDTRQDALRCSVLRVSNKRIALGKDDDPTKLEAVGGVMVDARIKSALEQMLQAAKKDRAEFVLVSGCRGFADQQHLYEEYEKRDGQQAADTFSARAGHSEHQLGLAIDIVGADHAHELDEAFKGTAAGRWAAAHAHEYGFVVRYLEKQEKLTGYRPEPWHLRYVGQDVAGYLHAEPAIHALEDLFGLPAAPTY